MDMSLSKSCGIVKDRKAWSTEVHGVAKSQTDLATKQKQQSRNIIKEKVLERQGEINKSIIMIGKFIMYFLLNRIYLIDIKMSQG